MTRCSNRPVTAETSPVGDFVLEAPLLAATILTVRKPGYQTQRVDAFDMPDPIVLARHAGGMSGVVYDSFGQPLEDAGALPVLLPNCEDSELAEQHLDRLVVERLPRETELSCGLGGGLSGR